MSRCRDRPHNVNELQSVVFYVLVVDQLLESQHTPPLTSLMNPSLAPITWFSLAPGWGIPGELSVQTRSYPLEKRSSLLSLRKKLPCISMIQVPTHQDDMTCIDFYLDDTSQLYPPCLVQCMWMDWEAGSSVPSPQPLGIGVRFHWVKWSVYLPACRRLLFPLLHACNKGNRRRLHAGKASTS